MIVVHLSCAWLSYAAFLTAFVAGTLFLIQEHQLKHKQMGFWFHRLPSLETLDRLNFQAIGAGWALLTMGMVLGVSQARDRLGSWWTGDAKEVLTVALWATYLLLWLVRLRSTLRGRRVALLSVIGFVLVVVSLVGAGRLLPNRHPYL